MTILNWMKKKLGSQDKDTTVEALRKRGATSYSFDGKDWIEVYGSKDMKILPGEFITIDPGNFFDVKRNIEAEIDMAIRRLEISDMLVPKVKSIIEEVYTEDSNIDLNVLVKQTRDNLTQKEIDEQEAEGWTAS